MWYIHMYSMHTVYVVYMHYVHVVYMYHILYTAGLLRPKLFVAQDFEMISLGN